MVIHITCILALGSHWSDQVRSNNRRERWLARLQLSVLKYVTCPKLNNGDRESKHTTWEWSGCYPMFVKESLSLMGISCKGCSLGRTKLWKRKWISSRSAFILVKPLFSDQTFYYMYLYIETNH